MSTDAMTSKPIERRPEFAAILRDDQLFASGRRDDAAERLNGWFDTLMIQSGLEISPSVMVLLSVFAGILLGGLTFVIQESLLSTALAVGIGGFVPVVAALGIRSRRQNQMLRQMPGMVDELARAARTGRSLEQCFELVVEDTPAPLGKELLLCSRRMQMGEGLGRALHDLPLRTGLVSLHVLVTALTVHHQTGGDLVHVLERLSHTIRDRLTFLGRLRAATTASRATAILMITLPPGILTFFIFRDPAYFTNLMSSSWGRGTTILAIVLQIIGSIWILRILKQSQRT